MLFGIYARFKGIATWPLSDDEYHTVASVNNLLEHGFPYFDCGGIYSRGMLYQYFLAFLNLIFGENEILAYRSANALFSLLALPAIYLLTKKIAGKESAIIALLFYLVSTWEVEYARLIRMYMPFQILFVWYLLYLYKVTIENNLDKLKHLLIISVVSVFVFEEGIFLTIINITLLAFIDRANYKETKIKIFAGLSVLISAASLLYLRTDFTHFGLLDNLPADINPLNYGTPKNTLGPLQLPLLLLPHLVNYKLWFFSWIPLCIPAITSLIITTKYYRSWPIFLLSFLVVLFVALNLFTLALLSIATFYFLGWLSTERAPRHLYLHIIFVAIIYGIFWITFSINTDILTIIYGDTTVINLKKALVVLFKYPNYYNKILSQWYGGMPAFTVIFSAIIFVGLSLGLIRKKDRNKFIDQLFIILLLISTMVAISLQPYHNSRYTFMLYPVAIIVLVYYLHVIINLLNIKRHNNSALLVSALCLLYISDDHVFSYLNNIDSKEINFKIGFTAERRFHLRNRLDFLTPAEYINERLTPSDLVVTAIRPVDYYLNRLDYYYITPEDSEFKGVSACAGEKEIWTNANLLYDYDMLVELLENRNSRIWIIMYAENFSSQTTLKKVFDKEYKSNLAYTSIDGYVAVYRFDKL